MPPENLATGVGSFNRYGHNWVADSVTRESNSLFCWVKVVARWSNFGPPPLWPKEPRTFYFFRRRIADGHWIET